jgi:hypothetical protein
MEKSFNPNISPLEIEVEDKFITAYLFEIAAKANQRNVNEVFHALHEFEPEQTISKSSAYTTEITEHGITKLISNYRKSQNKAERAKIYQKLIQQIRKDR